MAGSYLAPGISSINGAVTSGVNFPSNEKVLAGSMVL